MIDSFVAGSGGTITPQSLSTSSSSAPKPSTIRPLTAAYQASSGINQVCVCVCVYSFVCVCVCVCVCVYHWVLTLSSIPFSLH